MAYIRWGAKASSWTTTTTETTSRVQRPIGGGLKERFDISTCTVRSSAAEPGEDNRTAKCHILSNDTFGDHLEAKRNVCPAWRALKDMWKALGLPTTTTTATTSKFLCRWWRCFHADYKVSLEYLQKISVIRE